jgi:ABC-type antimicrobial peptide transport system permease subunit
VLAIGLASFGLFGVMSYNIARRTSELGLRLALGAEPRTLLRMVLIESLVPVLIGLAVGVPLVFAAARLVAGMLYGVAPTDPSTIAGAISVLLAAAFVAGLVPAWRASRVDPMVALRHE